MSGPGLTDQERETLLGAVQNWCADDAPFGEVVATVEHLLAVRGVSSVQADDDLRARVAEAIYAGGDEPEWLSTVDGTANAASYELADRALAALPASPAPTEDRGVGSDVIERVRALADEFAVEKHRAAKWAEDTTTAFTEAMSRKVAWEEAERRLRAALAPSTPEDQS